MLDHCNTGLPYRFLQTLIVLLIFASCSFDEEKRFTRLNPSDTQIDFVNRVENTPEFNIQNYLYFYDGGGVAAGDINNDGLPDLFFIANNGQHKLYLNRGNYAFEEITQKSGISSDPGSWSTGVSMADVNGNGFLDIYISRVNFLNKTGANQLFINNGDLTFTERASDYGLDFEGYSTQAAFFDYNGNGRLDLFLLNHSFHSENTYGRIDLLRSQPSLKAGDRLFRNDGDGFSDVTEEAGINSSALGYGLGLAITDINLDGYPDIYVGNDFHEDDYFYINNGDGTFTDSLYDMVGHTSNSSMGNDVGDIDNNGRMDIVSLDMMPDDHEQFLRSGGPDLMMVKEAKSNFGFGEKNNRNTLQINRGFPSASDQLPVFSETAFAAGIAKTDWSWSALLADYDNDGFNDLFITNGIPKRPNDLDYVSNLQQVRERYTGEELTKQKFSLIESMPQTHVPNKIYRNNGNLTFADSTDAWGFSHPTYSSGAVYTDLNGNGLLDLVINNTNETAGIYKNNPQSGKIGSYLKVRLKGSRFNSTGIGTKVFVYSERDQFYREQFPVRGFQSSVEHTLHFGLGEVTKVDSLLVIWPGGRYETVTDPPVGQSLELNIENAGGRYDYTKLRQGGEPAYFNNVTADIGLLHRHRENRFDDFYREPLMPYKLSNRGPATAVGDLSGNGLDDIYIGGAKGNSGVLYLQREDGVFVESDQSDFVEDRRSEDVDALFFDATGNGHLDLLVVSGGYEYPSGSRELLDRLYINDGEQRFVRSENAIPKIAVNGSVVRAADIDGDGDLDLFIGGHADPWQYGIGPRSFLLENDGNGIFRDITSDAAPDLATIGNVTSAEWIVNPDSGLPDLVVAGEWMPVHYFENNSGTWNRKTEELGLDRLKGLWQSVETADLNHDGYPDVILGNFGINSRLAVDKDQSIRMYVNDFNGNGQTAPLISLMADEVEKPFEQLDELLQQVPSLEKKISGYKDFSEKRLSGLFDQQMLDEALKKEITVLQSLILLSKGDGEFDVIRLPNEAQWFPLISILPEDINGDGNTDLVLGGNLFDVKPSMGGRQDAGYGLVLLGDGKGNFQPLSIQESGIFAEGQIRNIRNIRTRHSKNVLMILRNNQSPLFYKWNR